MYYINPTPNESGNHSNPMGQPFPNCVTLPDDLLSPYLAAKGFVTLTVENGAVTSLETNQEALDAYEADRPPAGRAGGTRHLGRHGGSNSRRSE